MTCVSVYSVVKERPARPAGRTTNLGGAERDRTADPLVANQVLSQLSYSPWRPVDSSLTRSGAGTPEVTEMAHVHTAARELD